MALHARNQVRNAMLARLTGLPTTGASVFKSRVFPMDDSVLPGLIVYTNDEIAERRSVSPLLHMRTVELLVEGYAKSASQVDDELDQIAKEVEVAIAADPALGGAARDCYLKHTRFDMVDGDKNVGCIRLTYEATYRVLEKTPDVIL